MAVLLLLVTSLAEAGVVNGSFETGDTTGWNVTNLEAPYSAVTQYSPSMGFIHAYDGLYYMSLSNDHTNGFPAEISQTVTTVAGQDYFLTFHVNILQSALSGVEFTAYWNQTVLLNTVNPTDRLNLPQSQRDVWQDYTFQVRATGLDTIAFDGYNDPRFNGLDDVSLVTPLPGNMTLCLIAAAIGICYVKRQTARA